MAIGYIRLHSSQIKRLIFIYKLKNTEDKCTPQNDYKTTNNKWTKICSSITNKHIIKP